MGKMTVTCQDWRAMRRNTLQGFAAIRIDELRLIVHDVAVHEKEGRRWAQLPAKPQVRDGALVIGDGGKPQYFPVLEFADRATRDAFGRAVVAAILAHEPRAFADGAERPQSPHRGDLNDEIGF